MNFRRVMLTGLATIGLMASLAAPVAMADQATSSASVTEGGGFAYSFWSNGGTISFTPATVTTSTSQKVTQDGANHRVLLVNDNRSYSPGYQLQMSATNLTSGSYFIDKANLSVKKAGGGPHSSCLDSGVLAANPVVGGNPYQSVTFNLGGGSNAYSSSTVYTPLSSSLILITGSAGRGCGGLGSGTGANGGFQSNYAWELNVPAGTYTGNGTAVYTGSITISEVAAP